MAKAKANKPKIEKIEEVKEIKVEEVVTPEEIQEEVKVGEKENELTMTAPPEIVVVEEPKEDEEEEKKEPEITVVPMSTEPVIQKNVKVITKVKHKCYIGGVWYYFEKGKQYNVPENVKRILRDSDLLAPL